MSEPTLPATAAASVTPTFVPATTATSQPQFVITTPPAGKYSDEDLNKVRQQEKDKLYPEIERLKAENARLQQEHEARVAAENAARAEAEAAAKAKADAETDIRTLMEQQRLEWEQKLAEEKAQREAALAVLNQERAFQEVQNYKQQAVAAAQAEIIPELLNMVSGNTPEEIDASIAGLKATSASILESAQQAMQTQRQSMAGARVTAPAAGPLDTTSENQPLDPAQIANLSVSEYAKVRSRLLGQAATGNNRGLFG